MIDDRMQKILFSVIALLALAFAVSGYLHPPSKKAYNPQKAYFSQEFSEKAFSPPPNIDPKTQTSREITEQEIEQWRAERSDLAAQWETADMAHLAFRVGILGIILVAFTLAETREAANGAWEAVRVAKAEAMPNLMVEDITHTATLFNDGIELSAHRVQYGADEGLILSVEFNIKNIGKTVAKSVNIEMRAGIRANSTEERVIISQVGDIRDVVVQEPGMTEPVTRFLQDMPPTDSVPIRQGFAIPYGEAVTFTGNNVTAFTIHRIELSIKVSFKTDYGDEITTKQVFGLRALKENGIVERIASIQEFS